MPHWAVPARPEAVNESGPRIPRPQLAYGDGRLPQRTRRRCAVDREAALASSAHPQATLVPASRAASSALAVQAGRPRCVRSTSLRTSPGSLATFAIGGPRARPRRLGLLARTRRASIASVTLSRGSAPMLWDCAEWHAQLPRWPDGARAMTDQSVRLGADSQHPCGARLLDLALRGLAWPGLPAEIIAE